MSKIDLTNLSGPQLYEALAHTQRTLAEFKTYEKEISGEIERRFAEGLKQMRAQAGKDTGTIEHDLGDGLFVQSVVDKKADWDSDLLLSASADLSWQKVQTIFKFKLSIPEAIYKALAAADLPDEVRKKIETARTTKYSEKISLIRKA